MDKIDVHSPYSVKELQLVKHSDILDAPSPSANLFGHTSGPLVVVYIKQQ